MSYSPEGHILQRYDDELLAITKQVSAMGEMVVGQLAQALTALENGDLELAGEVIRREHQVNELEVGTDTRIFSLIARLCPVAGDLRALVTASKIINNLERIGDEAAKLANFVLALHNGEHNDPLHCPLNDVIGLGKMALTSARQAITAYEHMSEAEADQAIAYESEVSAEFEASLHRLMNGSSANCCNLGNSVNTVLMLKALERVGQHAQNIAEYLVFLLRGIDIRHRASDAG